MNPLSYEIIVQGELDPGWSEWFNGMTIQSTEKPGSLMITTLSGDITDQSALRGILTRLWDLNLALVSVRLLSKELINKDG